MFLSIITINRNNIAALKATLNSVVMQSFCDYEYIVIDGNSSDGSVDVIKKFEGVFLNEMCHTNGFQSLILEYTML